MNKEYTLHLMGGNTIKTRQNENEYFIDGTYKRAKVSEKNGAKDLYSYNIRVARITKNGDFIRLWEGYSQTTMKHINKFRIENNLPTLCAKEWKSLPVNKSTKKRWIFKVIVFNKNGKVRKESIYEKEQMNNAITEASKYYKELLAWRYIEQWAKSAIGYANEYNDGDMMQLENAQIQYVYE